MTEQQIQEQQQQNQEHHHHHHHHSEHHHHHHSGHHHHHDDWATTFKYKSLEAIENKKKLEKWLFYALCGLAVIMFIAVLVVYWI